MSTLFDQQSTGKGSFITWRGQVVDDSFWRDNVNPKLHEDTEESGEKKKSKAWGYRYKVRILGHQTKNKKEVRDEELLMAEVMYPVTAGSGHAGSRQTPNIRMGDFVWGFFEDGMDGQRPIIIGVIGNNDNTELCGGDPEEGFQPRTGQDGLGGPLCKVADKDQLLKSQGSGKPVREGTGVNVASVADAKQALSGNESTALPVAKKEEESEVDAIQVIIKNLLAVTNKIKSSQSSFFGAATSPTKLLQSELNKSARAIASFIKKILSKIRGTIITAMDNIVKDTVYLIFPNQRPILNEATNKGTDTLSCVINKIIDGLFKLMMSFLKEVINNYVNAPMCAVENAINKMLDGAAQQVSGALDSVFGEIDSVIGGLTAGLGGALGSVTSLASQIADILSFFSCDPASDVPEIREWSPFAGIKVQDPLSGPLNDILAKAGEDLGLGQGGAPPCNIGPQPTTNPALIVAGGNPTVAALINPIISPVTGGIIGVDIGNPGSGYQSQPSILVGGNPGGSGASLTPIMTGGSVTGVVVRDTGSGYGLGDGSTTGPNGTPFSGPGDTVVFKPTPGVIIPAGTLIEGPYAVPDGTKVPEGTLIEVGTDLPFPILGPDGNPITQGMGQGMGPMMGPDGMPMMGQGPVVVGPNTIPVGTVISSPTPIDIEVPSVLDLPGDLMFDLPDTGYTNTQDFGSNDDILKGGWNSYPPGTTIQVAVGDCIHAPVGSIVEVVDSQGNIVQQFIGQGQTVSIKVEGTGSFTTPQPDEVVSTAGSDPSDGSGKYPVVLEIKDVLISSPGYNYTEGDEIVLIPDNGAILKPVFGNFGVLKDVKVINPGVGFNDLPDAFIKSLTGINAVIQPVFNVINIGEDAEDANKAIDLPEGATVISVIDCVGKIDQEI